MEKNKKIKKIISNLIIFILLIGLTFFLVFKDQDVSEILNVAMGVKKQYLLIAILAMCIYISCESINVKRTLNALGEKTNFFQNIRYTLIGFFFSSITPAASGGQPMEIYYMHKDKVSVANSTLALLMQLSSFQIVTISIGIISAVLNFDVIKNGLIYLVVIGILLNSTALALLLISILSKKLSDGLIKIAIKILKFFKVKNIEDKKTKLESELSKYQESAVYIKSHKLVMLKTLLTTLIQVIVYYSIPYWVYLAFGFSGFNIFQIITLQAVLYATVSGIPSPGAVGVSEGGFIGIFKNVFPQTMISSAMLLNRGISFYLLVLISGVVVIVTALRTKKTEKIENSIEQENVEIKEEEQ